MKHGLLNYKSKTGKLKNIGDQIQSIAARQFLDKNYKFVYREELNKYSGENIKLIMNAWWMHHPENWPPSTNIHPLFISFHITPTAAEILLSDKNLAYFKKHEPIGCRDLYTKELFEQKGIKSYLSGCLTLTLGKSYKNNTLSKNISIVNPYFYRPSLKNPINVTKSLFKLIFNYKYISQIAPKLYPNQAKILSLLKTTYFYKPYSKLFDKKLLANANYYSHSVNLKNFKSDKEIFEHAEYLLDMYQNSKLVITSRLHAALPSLSMDTPTIFVFDDKIQRSSNRFSGLIEHLNVIKYEKNRWVSTCHKFELPKKIKNTSVISNKNTHNKLVENLLHSINKNLKDFND